MFDLKLGGNLTKLLDYRWVKLPDLWPGGLAGIELEILRTSHPSWKSWLAEKEKRNPLIQAMVERIMGAAVLKGAGGSSKKKGRAASEHDIDESILMSGGRGLLSVIKDSELADVEGEIRDGAARILWRGWRGVTASGAAVEPTAENRARFMAMERDGEPIYLQGEIIGVEIPYGGQYLRDALFQFTLEEGAKQDLYAHAFVEGATGNSAPSPAGSPVTGSGGNQLSDGA